MVIHLIEALDKFSYFSEYCSILQKPKIIYLRYLNIFLEALNMCFEFIGCQNISRIVSGTFGSI
jgi:hypothetical protein